jgi:UDP-3-O-[3-hydroxymyristoyl] glucosamine N-acyltransferase
MPEYTLGQLAKLFGAKLVGGDSTAVITAVAPLAEAGKGQLSFLGHPKYRKFLADTQAEVVLLAAEDAGECPVPALVIDNPAVMFAQVAGLFERKVEQPNGIHETAVIGNDCQIDATASIGARCVIGNHVKIGKNTKILPGTVLADFITIGDDCLIYANVTFYQNVIVGSQVIIHSGTVIGSDGFGNANQDGQWIKTPQLGRVVIGNDVEIGANTTIDCGAIGDTVIEDGVRLDNLIQIAHNVRIGAHTAIAAQTGIAGSTKVGKQCMFGGQVGIIGHLNIGDGVLLTSKSGVSKSLKDRGIYSSGMPVMPHGKWNRCAARFRNLNELNKDVSKLKKAVSEVKEHEYN